MLTLYSIPCSCGCNEIIQRAVYATKSCQVKGHREKLKNKIQVFQVGEGIPVEKKERKIKPPIQTIDFQTPNLSKSYFTRKKK